MNMGYVIPQNWGLADPADVIELGGRAEALGYDSVWVSHHILNVGYVHERLGDRPYYDALTTLTWVAARTTRVRLGTTVPLLPYLNPLVLAKTVVTLGVGVATLEEENRALSSNYATRGAYANEAIQVLRELWTADDPAFAGRFFNFAAVRFSPRPRQPGGVPILVGGGSRAALGRCARLGDGWNPIGGSVAALKARIGTLSELWAEHGRDGMWWNNREIMRWVVIVLECVRPRSRSAALELHPDESSGRGTALGGRLSTLMEAAGNTRSRRRSTARTTVHAPMKLNHPAAPSGASRALATSDAAAIRTLAAKNHG